MTENSRDDVVQAALAQVSRLATLPEVTARLVRLIDDPDSSADDLADLLERDAVLAARVLKVVNSSFYGMPAEVLSIRQAVVVLGFSGLKNIALAASLAKLFRGGSVHESFTARGLWQHSSAVAAAAKMLADATGDAGDELFLIGLMHDVGLVIEMQALRAGFIEVIETQSSDADASFCDTELAVLGATHEDFGMALCEKWNFPPLMREAVGFHHRPGEIEGEGRRAAEIICVADHLAGEAGIGYCGTVEGDPWPDAVILDLGLDTPTLDDIRARLPEAAAEADQLDG